MDDTVPGIVFDKDGECNYCKIHWALEKQFPTGEEGQKIFNAIVSKIKASGKNNEYDCIIGVSGGTDSCYLLHLAKENGLRPLAVNLDNGWNSEIAVNNIKKCTTKLNIDLITYVINWEEMRDICLSYLKASLPWADNPTDIAITSALYKIASQENIKYIMVGADFRSEGKQPSEWTYGDGRMLKYIQKKFGKLPLKTFPNLTMWSLIYYGFIKGIKNIRPLYNLKYNKAEAQKLLEEKYNWEYYGGHHYESTYTNFVLRCLLPDKFRIDKRKVTFSAQIRAGHKDRGQALTEIDSPSISGPEKKENIDYVIKKLGLNMEEFNAIMTLAPKKFSDYPSYYPLIKHFGPLVTFILKFIFTWSPTTIKEREIRNIS